MPEEGQWDPVDWSASEGRIHIPSLNITSSVKKASTKQIRVPTCALLGLDQSRSTVNADNQATCDLRVERTTMSSFLDA